MFKILLFISAFVPMYILFLINLIVELVNNNLSFNITNSVVLISLIIFIFMGVGGIILATRKKVTVEETGVKILSKRNLTDQHFLNYFSLFVLLALTFDLSKICYICVLIVIMIFLGIVYIKNNIFYINPILNILGYSFYDITYSKDGEQKEIRIFYKGQLDIENKKYDLCVSNRNLNFLKDCDIIKKK